MSTNICSIAPVSSLRIKLQNVAKEGAFISPRRYKMRSPYEVSDVCSKDVIPKLNNNTAAVHKS